MKKLPAFFISIFLFIFLIAACSADYSGPAAEKKSELNNRTYSAPKSGGKITIAVKSNINLDPLTSQTDEEKSIGSLVFEGLVKLDGQGRVNPALARSWEISDDGRTYTFKLLDNVKWHNGERFSSSDVKATFDKIREIKKEQSKKSSEEVFPEFDNIESYSAPDSNTFIVNLFKPDANFLYDMTRGILPASSITLGRASSKDFKDHSSQIANLIGTGKYKVAFQGSDFIDLKKNESYYDKKPYIDEIAIKIFQDSNSMKEAFKDKQVDMISIEPSDWGIFQNQPDVSLLHYPSRYFEFMALNLNNSLFRDVTVRQAILMSIDRNKILEDTTLGKGIVIDGPILPISWAYNSQIQHMTFNREKARQLLRSAGWSDQDGDGILEKKIKGRKLKFEFELLVNSSNGTRYQIATNIQKDLKEVGISVNLTSLTWEELKKKVINRKYDAALMAWKLSAKPDISFMFSKDARKGGYNFVSYSNPKLDDILMKAQSTSLEQERKAFLDKAQDIISRDLPYIFLYSPNSLLAINNRIKGFQPDPINIFNNVNNWWVE